MHVRITIRYVGYEYATRGGSRFEEPIHYLIEDVFSKWVEALPPTEVRGRDVIHALKVLVTSRYGYPKILVSDNGTQFNNNVVRNFCAEHDIQQVFSSISHHQANSAERRVQSTVV